MTNNKPLSTEEQLKYDITSIMYGANWEDKVIAIAFKPDVEAAMKLIKSFCKQETIKAKITELKRAKIQSYITAPHMHKVDRRIEQLERELHD